VVKFSNRGSDTRSDVAPPRYRKGSASQFFRNKAEQLTAAQVALKNALPAEWRHPHLYEEDARLLPSFGWEAFDHVLTSPPYPGTYDYYDHHRLRMAWLGLAGESFHSGEIGARRESERTHPLDGLQDSLDAMGRVLKSRGSLYVVIGDWIDDGRAVSAAEAMRDVAQGKGWHVGSWASARREVYSRIERDAFARSGKWEHLLQFVRG